MVELIPLIEEMKLPRHEFLGDTTQAITDLTCSPGKSNVIPDLCTLTIDRRTIPSEIPENVQKEFQELFGRSSMPEIRAEMRVTKNAPPAYVPADSVFVKTAPEAVASVMGKNPELSKYKFGTDASYLSTIARIPTVGFGPGDEMMAHSPNENIPVDEVIIAAKVYAILAARLLK
jgi:succinyl-diaminopimelate desuccinylase